MKKAIPHLKDIDIDRKLKWKIGIAEHRPNKADEGFQGDPMWCLYEELLDALNYMDEYAKQNNGDGEIFWSERPMMWNFAEKVRQILSPDSTSSRSSTQRLSGAETGPSTPLNRNIFGQLKSLHKDHIDLFTRHRLLSARVSILEEKT